MIGKMAGRKVGSGIGYVSGLVAKQAYAEPVRWKESFHEVNFAIVNLRES